MSVMLLPIFTTNADEIPDMDDIAEKIKKSQEIGEEMDMSMLENFAQTRTIGTYNERMLGVFQDMYNLGYI
jgi:hypothetical protein